MSEDQFIQRQFEDGNAPSGEDADAYRLVFRALKKEPAFKLGDDFANKVSLIAFERKKSFDWDKFFFIAGITTFAFAMMYAIAATEFIFSVGSFQFLAKYSYFVIFAIAIVALLHWIDKKFLKTLAT